MTDYLCSDRFRWIWLNENQCLYYALYVNDKICICGSQSVKTAYVDIRWIFQSMSTYAGSLSECQKWLKFPGIVNIRWNLPRKITQIDWYDFRWIIYCDRLNVLYAYGNHHYELELNVFLNSYELQLKKIKYIV